LHFFEFTESILHNLGKYIIKAVKDGIELQICDVSIVAGEVAFVTIQPFTPKLKITQSGDKFRAEMQYKTGVIKLQSLPVEAEVSIKKLGFYFRKTDNIVTIEDVMIGKYTIDCIASGKTLTAEITVYTDVTTDIFFNFISGTVEDRTKVPQSARQAGFNITSSQGNLPGFEAESAEKFFGVDVPQSVKDAFAERSELIALKKALEESLAELSKTYQPTSPVVAGTKQRLEDLNRKKEQSQQQFLDACKDWLDAVEQEKKKAEARYADLIREYLPTAPQVSEVLAEMDRLEDLKEKVVSYYEPPVIVNSIGMRLIRIPAGSFMMGNDNGFDSEKPVHEVEITKDFYIGQYEVTQAQYQEIMGENPSRLTGSNNPVEQVSWYDATEFCMKLSESEGKTYRLPSEAEWEYACRSGSEAKHFSGDNEGYLGDYARQDGSDGYETYPAGENMPNIPGSYDMHHGNMWEWCLDGYDKNFYSKSPERDPLNTQNVTTRVLRGGCWFSCAFCSVSNRNYSKPEGAGNDYSFRVVLLCSP
jgi:formylglycine-generating enzyme required for sulfatase activity